MRRRWADRGLLAILSLLVAPSTSNDSSLFECPKGSYRSTLMTAVAGCGEDRNTSSHRSFTEESSQPWSVSLRLLYDSKMTSLNQAESRTAEKRYLSGWDVVWLSGQSGHGEQLEIKDTVLLPRAPVTPSGWESCGTKLVPVSRIILSLSYHPHTQDIKQKYWIANHPNNSKDPNGSVFITLCWLMFLFGWLTSITECVLITIPR